MIDRIGETSARLKEVALLIKEHAPELFTMLTRIGGVVQGSKIALVSRGDGGKIERMLLELGHAEKAGHGVLIKAEAIGVLREACLAVSRAAVSPMSGGRS